MSNGSRLERIVPIFQRDPGNRGLATPEANLFAFTQPDFHQAVSALADRLNATIGIVTGFWIPSWQAYETDGPPGAIFLSRILRHLGYSVRLYSDPDAVPLLQAGLACVNMPVNIVQPIPDNRPSDIDALIVLERVGPSHSTESIQQQSGNEPDALAQFQREVPINEQGRYRTMRGIDVTDRHRSIESWLSSDPPLTSIGIGDGGNETGMGKIPWSMIRRAIPQGGLIACRIPTQHLIVSGVSNWGAYALAAGLALLDPSAAKLFHPEQEHTILASLVQAGLVDGVTGRRTTSVDGLEWSVHAEVLERLQAILEEK